MPHGAQLETPDRFLSLLGLVASGDLGPITMYRSHLGRIVSFAKTYPAPLPSLAQLTGRCRMYFGGEQWRHFHPYQKQVWRHTVDVLDLCMTGYNLWIIWWFNPNWDFFNTVEHQTGINTLLAIRRFPPAMPTPIKFQRYDPGEERIGGAVRYARKQVVLPYSTAEYLPFFACHPNYPTGQEIPTWWTLYGPGSITYPNVYNNQWTYVRYTSPGGHANATLQMDCEWPNGDADQTKVRIFTKYF
jgi:hypothetical protein